MCSVPCLLGRPALLWIFLPRGLCCGSPWVWGARVFVFQCPQCILTSSLTSALPLHCSEAPRVCLFSVRLMSSFAPLASAKVPDTTLVLSVPRLVLSPPLRPFLGNVPCELGKNVRAFCFRVKRCKSNQLNKSIWSDESFKAAASVSVFCLGDLSSESLGT